MKCLVWILAIFAACKAAGVPENLSDIYGNLGDDRPESGVQNDENNYGDYDSPGGDEDAIDNPLEPSEQPPVILSKPLELVVTTGDRVVLPCLVSKNKDAVVMWKRQTNSSAKQVVLYQSGTPLTKFDNIKLVANNSLEVHVTSDNDLGSYVCQVAWSASVVPEIVHKVLKVDGPHIIELEANTRKLRPKEPLIINCKATGYPEPTISWHKNDMRLTIEGPTLEIPNVKFEDRGIYRCLADNKHNVAHRHIEIFVIHKPMVTVEKFLVSSDKEHDAELHCTVHAYPAPVVNWQKNGLNIGEQPPKIMLSRRHNTEENILAIKNLEEADFGTYTCIARNVEGLDQKNISLVRTPAVREFQKPEKGSRDVVLTWKVESKSPIVQHELQYKKKGEDEWNTIKPEVTNSSNGLYEIKYTLKGLEPGTYETRARSQNSHGWSDFSEVMPFEGVLAKHGDHPKHKNKKHKHPETTESRNVPAQHQQPEDAPKETAVGASQTGGCSFATSSISILSISLLMLSLARQ